VKVRNAFSGPTIGGAKLTSNEHAGPGGIGAVMQASVKTSAKSDAFGPLIPRLVTFSGALPVFTSPAKSGIVF
jgi:hypothetical protein